MFGWQKIRNLLFARAQTETSYWMETTAKTAGKRSRMTGRDILIFDWSKMSKGVHNSNSSRSPPRPGDGVGGNEPY
jgi:hypothetical protein